MATKAELEEKSLKAALKIEEDYPVWFPKGSVSDALMLIFQKLYIEGYLAGLNHGHALDMEAINKFLGGKK